MRPTRLEVEGFTAFRDRAVVDFTGADFFALVGPTGSGKSSILDAICFALYGSVPRYDDDRLVAPAITQGENEARVCLTFEVDGDEYVATRIVRRTANGASVREARLERGGEVLAGSVREMRDAVEELFGLSFSQFQRSVVLPQGDFARFLHDKPSDRQELIVRLLDLGVYDRMRTAAFQRESQGKNAIAIDEQRLGQLADCTKESLDAARAAVTRLDALRTALASAEAQVRALEDEAGAAERQAAAAREVVRALEAVKVPQHVRELGAARMEVEAACTAAEAAREAADRTLRQAQEAVEQLPDVAVLHQQLHAYDELDALRAEADQLVAARDRLGPEIETAETALREATEALRAAEHAYDAAVEDTVATELAAALQVGQPCPVCGQVVHHKPKVRRGEKARAARARDAARTKEAQARRTLEELKQQEHTTTTQLASLRKRIAELGKKIAGAPEPAEITVQFDAARDARKRRDDAQRAFQRAVDDERKARERLSKIDTDLTDARRTCDAQRDPLVAAGLAVPGIGADLVADWDALSLWAAQQAPEHKALVAEHTERAKAATRARDELISTQVAAAREAGVTVPGREPVTMGSLRDLVGDACRDARAEVKRITEGMKEARTIERRVAETREAVEVASELARLLRADGFERWLVNEALRMLVVGASETLEQLSNGQYALAVDAGNEFQVVDHRNADERRPVKTLSGGETFQASLALALALADQIGTISVGGGGKLDAIFLDEGFGTLDPDALDTVASTLEALGSDGRMVGIVTHVRELGERVPVRFEVVKGPRTSTVTRVDAA